MRERHGSGFRANAKVLSPRPAAGSSAGSIATGLLLTGSGLPINGFERAVDALTGAPLPGFPAVYQELNFLGMPAFADVTGDGAAEIIEGSDSNTVHAFTANGGAQAETWPKFHTGWTLWGPSTGDLDGDGDIEVVATTREGWIFVWETPGTTDGNAEWWSSNHDEWNTGRYGTDTRPPGIVRDARADGRDVSFTVPGDDWYAGAPEQVDVTFDSGAPILLDTPTLGQQVAVPAPDGATTATIQVTDDEDLVSRAVTVDLGSGAVTPVAAPTPAPSSPAAPTSSAPTSGSPLPATGGGLAKLAVGAALALATRRRR